MQKRFLCLLLIFFLLPFSIVFSSDYENHWAKNQIQSALNNKLASGTTDGNFEPDRNITRGEFINLLVHYTKLKSTSFFTSFNDIRPGSWYFPAIVIAEENKIIKGYEDGSFHPEEAVTRQDAITFICRAYNLNPLLDNPFISYSDFNDISNYAKNYIYFALNNNIIIGYENQTIKPKNPITRAEAIVILDNFSELSDSFTKVPEFVDDYPKISSKGNVNNIAVELKVSEPCSIYYKSIKRTGSDPIPTPKKDDINQFLATITTPNTVLTSNIMVDSYKDTYNLYFVTVANHGVKGDLKKIKDAMPLAYSEGDGSIEDPYMIYTENQLDYMRYCQNKHFKLANDIILEKNWIPIDASGGYFGSFNGNGYTISNLNIKDNSTNSGLFSILKSGIIKNLSINGNIESKNNVGLFAGKSEDSIISNCVASGFVKATSNNAGGLVGINNGIIENSLSAVYSVESITYAGGFSGSGKGKITNCLSAAHSVLSDMYAGGISGINNTGKISNCIVTNLNVVDFLTSNSGRITTNKENGITKNNYGFNNMNTNASNFLPDADSNNGIDISWKDITSEEFYKNTLNWDFNTDWKMPDSDTSNFILPIPKIFKDVYLSEGITPYAPIKINTAEKLKQINPEYHYILTTNIQYNDNWTSVSTNESEGFNGSFDGNGYAIYGINIPYSDTQNSYSMFGKITDGTVRNLTLYDFKSDGSDSMAVIADKNYGIIENCKIKGNIIANQVKNSVSCGSIVAINYGTIENCQSEINFVVHGNSITIGGIASHNEGFINNTSYIGKIDLNTKGLTSSSSVGGIVGFNNEGSIYNSYANPTMYIKSYTNYSGGICGILNSGEIFKTSSTGTIKTNSQNTALSTSYTGGICGLSSSGLIVNSFSDTAINTTSTINYSGGISGYNISSNIQNTYTLNKITQFGGSFLSAEKIAKAGGIAGVNENGFLSDNVAINPWIITNGILKRICNSVQPEFISNNYAYKNIIKEVNVENNVEDGISVTLNELRNIDFFFLPVHLGGKLGWSSEKYEKENGVWTTLKKDNNTYKFPILNNLKQQQIYTMPKEFK